MLHRNVLMADIDVDHWRNAQALLLRSAKGARRVVCIHEDGRVLKLVNTTGAPVNGTIAQVDDPHAVAQALYELNADTADFVVVFERNAVDSYFAQIQDAWNIDDDLDVFVQRTYAAIDDYPQGMVTYPDPARETLGLQWRVGASRDQVAAALRTFVAPGTTAVLGVHDGGALWTSLVLDVDDEWSVTSVTTADPSLVDLAGGRAEVLNRLVAQLRGTGKTVSLALSIDREAAVELLAASAERKPEVLAALRSAGKLSVGPGPEGLTAG